MQESKFLQELTIGEGYRVSFVLAQSGGADTAQLVVYYLPSRKGAVFFRNATIQTFCTAAELPQKGRAHWPRKQSSGWATRRRMAEPCWKGCSFLSFAGNRLQALDIVLIVRHAPDHTSLSKERRTRR